MKNKLESIFKNTDRKKSTFIIAEMAWSHDGSFAKAKKIIKGAATSGADAISFHINSIPDLFVKNYKWPNGKITSGAKKETMYEYLNRINIKNKDWKRLFSYARRLGLIICVMPGDMKSLEFCRTLKPDMYVLSASCFTEKDFVIEMAKQKKPIILRIGGAILQEIKDTINLIKRQGVKKIILLHGIQLYPTKIEDINLNLIPFLEKTFKLPVGLADHIEADSELASIIPLLAIPLGVKVIEKHLTHNRSLKGLDYVAALNPVEFKKFVVYIREAEKALGSSYFKGLSKAELEYQKTVRKRIVALRDIKKGEKITKENITFKRANDGVYPDQVKYLIGKTAKYDIKKDESILKEKLT